MHLASSAAIPAGPRIAVHHRLLRATSLAGLLALTLAHPSGTRIHTWPWSLIAAVLALAPIVLLVQIALSGEWRRPSAPVTAGLLLLAAGGVASASTSPFAMASLARTPFLLAIVALALVLHHALSQPDPHDTNTRAQRLAHAIAIGGAIIAGVSFVGWWKLRAEAGGPIRNEVPFGHSTYTGGVMLLLLPWLLRQAWRTRAWQRALWALVSFAAGIALATTSSRGAVLALVAVLGVAVIVAVFRARWPRARKLIALGAAVAVALAAIFSNQRLRDLVIHRAWSDAASESNRQRGAMLEAGWRLGQQRPLLGWGAGTVPLAYPRVRAQLDGGVANVLQLHSAPAQLWATLGGIGVAAAALIATGVAGAAARALRQARERSVVLAALASLGGYALFSLTDHQFDLPVVAVLVTANGAILTATGSRPAQMNRRWRRLAVVVVVALLLAPAWALFVDLRARLAYDHALAAWETGNAADFIAALDRATTRAPHDSFYQHQAAAALLRTREQERDSGKRLALALDAAARLDASLRTGAHEEFAHFNLGWLHLELGDNPRAARHFASAAHLVPDKRGVYFGLGLALRAAGRETDAVRAFALEWLNDPRSLTSPAWEVPALAPLRPAVRTETLHLLETLRDAHPGVSRAAPWLRWWLGETPFATPPGRGFTAEAARFSAALPAIARRAPIASNDRWADLYRAWLTPSTPAAFLVAAHDNADFAAALQRRAVRHADDFRVFLTAPTDDEAALVTTLRLQRTGYGVLALHPDGPLLTDLYIVQENRVAAAFASGLFPPQGWLPGRFLLALLPQDPP